MKHPFLDLALKPPRSGPFELDYLVYAIVEQEAGSRERIHWDAEKLEFILTGLILERPLPAPYGWLPQTFSQGDEAPLDVLILTRAKLSMGSYLIVRPVGVLLRMDQDHKVLAVDPEDALVGRVHDYVQLQEGVVEEIEAWFKPHFELEGWGDAQVARQMIEQDHFNFLKNQDK